MAKSSDGRFSSQWRRKRFCSAARREVHFFMSRLQISAIIVEPEVKEQRRNSSKFSHLELVSKKNEKGGKTCLRQGRNINYLKTCKRGHGWPKLKKIKMDFNSFFLSLFL